MIPIADTFEHDYQGCEILYGRGRIADLGEFLADAGLDHALVVCGSSTGSNPALMDPIEEGLGDRFAGVYDGTTPTKRVEEAFGVIEAKEETDADVLVGVGGGGSLDVARQATVLEADGRSLDELQKEAREGEISSLSAEGASGPGGADGTDRTPFVVVPTTFAGADVSTGGSLEVLSAAESPTGQPKTVSGSPMPIADVADPALFETTPTSALAGSAMNGFNKGIETPYARDASPVSDAAAVHGLRLLRESLPHVASEGSDSAEHDLAGWMDRAVVGCLLVQLDRKVSVIHAFGHGFARRYDVQQGDVHAIVAPHVLAYLFEHVDASRRALATGLDVDTGGNDEAVAEGVVDAVRAVRDGLDVPTRLRDLPEARREDLPAIAAFIASDGPMKRAPADLDASPEDIEAVLEAAW